MGLQARVQREFKFITALIRTLRRVGSISAQSSNLICDDLEAAVDSWRERRAITFEGRTLSYGEMDAIANRYAHWAIEHGVRRGQTVALYMANCAEYLSIWYGLSKVGVATALINNNLAGEQLAHCLNISGAAHVICDAQGAPQVEALRGGLARPAVVWTLGEAAGGLRDLAKALRSCSALRPDRSVRNGLLAKETALYIYTSGTTGPPKAAKVTHVRAQLYMRGFAAATNAHQNDRVYVTLPLYHATGGLCAMGAALLTGGSVVLKTKFSASQFWGDVGAEACTMFVYIGELCRYLLNQPEQPGEKTHALRMAFGNGLRPEVWEAVKTRFAIPEILEFYGSTEGNVSMFNFDGKTGAIGRVPPYIRSRFNVRLVRFDVETEAPVRGTDGLCQATAPGEVGECIGQIRAGDARAEYSGYADKAASEKKILRDVFAKGDAWFATGDLMRQDDEGYFYFVDRVGDTFRWKGENVSTSEVAEQLSVLPEVKEATVYGVRVGDLDGRAGMASLVVGPAFDIAGFAAEVDARLAPYARPIFVRLQPEIETTGTFKYRKMDLVADGFDPARIRQPLYVRDGAKGYVKVTKATFDKIQAGDMRL
ncbi:MAG: long-chain-acyl-CoA synthetase [Caulobacteraceae bacterium]|nr:long-chain-acyl-CoA synthetase [Caulobacteraceae bacterium]